MLGFRLDQLPRVTLAHGPTPLEYLPRFSEAVGAPIWIKRDDIESVGLAGNKVRKLEYSLAAALAEGATTVVTVGAVQSNHVRATACAVAKLDLRCVALLGGAPPAEPVGNHLLDLLFGAEVEFIGESSWTSLGAALGAKSLELQARGDRPFAIPMGGSTALGAIGLARGFIELAGQLADGGVTASRIVHASSTGGTQAGLEVGRALLAGGPLVQGIAVAKAPGELEAEIAELATAAGRQVGLDRSWSPRELLLDHDHVGSAYGAPTPAGQSAIRLLARTEGILTDPVYTGKALAGLIDLARSGVTTDPLVFWHTGGTSALFDPTYGLPLASFVD